MIIDELADTLRLRALPQPDHASRYYWQCAAEGRLVIQRCIELQPIPVLPPIPVRFVHR